MGNIASTAQRYLKQASRSRVSDLSYSFGEERCALFPRGIAQAMIKAAELLCCDN